MVPACPKERKSKPVDATQSVILGSAIQLVIFTTDLQYKGIARYQVSMSRTDQVHWFTVEDNCYKARRSDSGRIVCVEL